MSPDPEEPGKEEAVESLDENELDHVPKVNDKVDEEKTVESLDETESGEVPGRVADNKWRKACADKGQRLTFCGVNAHFQNGVAERRIRELQEQAQTNLIHANKRWPTVVSANLWPYAVRMANDVFNATPDLKRKHVPIEAFSGTKVTMNPSHFSHFGCPVYVLDNDLQAGKKINKWQYRSRVGCYLGQSPQHARTVALVLSLETGLVLPQFHVKMDTTFQTMRRSFGAMLPNSQWKAKCHFEKRRGRVRAKAKTYKG